MLYWTYRWNPKFPFHFAPGHVDYPQSVCTADKQSKKYGTIWFVVQSLGLVCRCHIIELKIDCNGNAQMEILIHTLW